MRVYSEQQIAHILQRAADRQAESARAVPASGLTLAEIEALAVESGLDVAHIRAAAAELAPASPSERTRSATHVFVERTLDAPLTDAGWDEVVAELRNRFGKAGLAAYTPASAPSGDVAVVGKNREWSHTDGLGVETRVLVSDRGPQTRVRLSQRVGVMSEVGDSLMLTFALAILPTLGLMSSLKPTGLAAAVAALLALALFAGIYFWDKAWRKQKQAQLDALSDNLVSLLAASSPASGSAVPTPALSLDALGDAPDAADAARDRSGSKA